MLADKLNNWIKSLDRTIGDTEEEIEIRRAQNSNSCSVRSDVKALLQYINEHALPADVERGLLKCLHWNPFCEKKGD